MRRRGALTGFLFVVPWILGFFAFTLYPVVQTAMLSFHRVKVTATGIQQAWAGLSNYLTVFTGDVEFIDALIAYIREVCLYVPVILVFALIIAMLLNTDMKGISVFRTIFFLPVIITSGPVIDYLTGTGALTLPGNREIILMLTNALPRSVAGALGTLIGAFVTSLWNSGLQILIFLAALQKLDRSMYEAAMIDGASPWEIFWKLTLKQLNPMIILNVLLTIMAHSTFALNPIIRKIRVDLYAPERGFGYAAALSLIYFVLLLLVIGFFVLITRRREGRTANAR